MVYGRSYGRGRRFSRRRRYRKRRRYSKSAAPQSGLGKALAMAGTALAVARGVKGLLNVEYKDCTVTSTFNGTSVNSTGVMYYLPAVAQGITDVTRNGNSIRAKSFDMKGFYAYNGAGDDQQGIRCMIFIDYNFDGTNDPTISGDANSLLQSASINSFRDLDNTDRFRVLYDKVIFVDPDHHTKMLNIHKDLNHKVEYVGTSSAKASGGGGSLWCMLLSTQATANYPTIDADYRFRYIDN